MSHSNVNFNKEICLGKWDQDATIPLIVWAFGCNHDVYLLVVNDADFSIFFYWPSRLRQASHTKLIQSSRPQWFQTDLSFSISSTSWFDFFFNPKKKPNNWVVVIFGLLSGNKLIAQLPLLLKIGSKDTRGKRK